MFKKMNIPLARKVLEFAEDSHPDFVHDQQTFYSTWDEVTGELCGYTDQYGIRCGTAACMAGITCLLSPEVEVSGGSHVLFKGQFECWSTVAKELMGLTTSQAQRLFHDTCHQDDPETAAKDLLRSWIEKAGQEQ